MRIYNALLVSAALIAGMAAGYFIGKNGPEAENTVVSSPERVKKPISDVGESSSVRSLRARISELEKLLAEKNAAAQADDRAVNAVSNRQDSGLSHRERMAKMEKEDPARYTQITNRVATWRRRRAESARAKIDFLSSIDTSVMSKKDQAVHEEFQELVARREELEADLHDPDLDDDQRRRLFGQLRESGAKLRELAAKERDSLLSETARNLGFEGEDVREIVTTVKEIVEATDSGWGPGRGGRRHRGAR